MMTAMRISATAPAIAHVQRRSRCELRPDGARGVGVSAGFTAFVVVDPSDATSIARVRFALVERVGIIATAACSAWAKSRVEDDACPDRALERLGTSPPASSLGHAMSGRTSASGARRLA